MKKSQTTNFDLGKSNNCALQDPFHNQLKHSASLNHMANYQLSNDQNQNQQNNYTPFVQNKSELIYLSQPYNNQQFQGDRTKVLVLNDNNDQYENCQKQCYSNENTIQIKPIARITSSATTGKYLYYINLFQSDSKWQNFN